MSDKLFGDIVTKTRRAKASDLEHDFLKEGWSAHSVEHGVINTIGHSDTPKSGKTWVAEQVGCLALMKGSKVDCLVC